MVNENDENLQPELPKLTIQEVLKQDVIKLDLGGGDHPAQGYINVDVKYYPQVDLLLDITKLHEHFQSQSVDGMTCRDTLQCFSHADVRKILKSWYQLLKPRGKFIVQVYDIDEIIKALQSEEIGFEKFRSLAYGRQRDEYTVFRNCFTEQSLVDLLEKVGFVVQEVTRPPMRIKILAIREK